MRKAQTSVFAIIGIVLVFAVLASVILFNQANKNSFLGEKTVQTTFSESANLLQGIRDTCIETAVKNAIFEGSIYPSPEMEDALEAEINQKIRDCFSPVSFVEMGYTVSNSNPQTNVEINPGVIAVTGTFEVALFDMNSNQKSEVTEFSYSFDRSTFTSLELDNEGETKKETNLVSSDSRLTINVPGGVSFASEDGSVLKQIELKVVDKSEFSEGDYDSSSGYVIGNTVYSVTDSVVSGKVKTCINYEPSLLKGIPEDTLTIMQYDAARGVWLSVPSTVDKATNVVCAELDHFSGAGVGTNTFYFDDGTSFYIEHIHNPCGPNPDTTTQYFGGLLWQKRYAGITNLVPYKDSVWQLNNFCVEMENKVKGIVDSSTNYDYKTNFDEKSGLPPDEGTFISEYCGTVYPPLYDTLLVRGEGEDQEFEYTTAAGVIYRARGKDLPDAWLDSWTRNTPISFSAYTILHDRWNSKNTVRTTYSDWNPVEIFEPNEYAEKIKADFDDDDSPEENLILYGEEELGEPQKNCFNSKGEPVACFLCRPEGTNTAAWCDDLWGDLRENAKQWADDLGFGITELSNIVGYSFDSQKRIMNECYDLCKIEAEKKYNEVSSSANPHLIEWEPSGDGILDFKWVSGKLVRNYAVCEIDVTKTVSLGGVLSFDIPGLGNWYEGVSKCDIKTEDIATSMTWGYGENKVGSINKEPDYKEAVSSYAQYKKDNLDIGFSGVGNDDVPVEKIFQLDKDHQLCEDEAYLAINCTINDVCHVNFPDSEYYYEFCGGDKCPEGVNKCGGAEKITDNEVSCKITIPGVLHQGENPVEGWVRNTDESADVCSVMRVSISKYPCPGEKPENPEECPENTDQCETNDDCESIYGEGYSCVDCNCYPPEGACPPDSDNCNSDEDCSIFGLGYTCTTATCECNPPAGECPPETTDNCKNNGDCVSTYGKGYICDKLTCDCQPPAGECPPETIDNCKNNGNCVSKYGTGYTCDTLTCDCQPPAGECPPTTIDNCKNNGNCVSKYGPGATCNTVTCDCSVPPPTGTCVVCHYDQGQPGCFRQDNSACPQSWNGHKNHCGDQIVYGENPSCDAVFKETCDICGEEEGQCNNNGNCNGQETCETCPGDCGECPVEPPINPPPGGCGNGNCNGGETCSSCPADCGECPVEPPVNPPPGGCGNGNCNGQEDCNSCPADCGECDDDDDDTGWVDPTPEPTPEPTCTCSPPNNYMCSSNPCVCEQNANKCP